MVILPGLSVQSVMGSAAAIKAQYKIFKDDYTVYVLDRRENPPADYSMEDMARDTAFAMKALGPEGCCVFGASQGGMMAMCMAIDHPELVRKMALGSTAAKMDDRGREDTKRWIELAQSGDLTALTAELIDSLYSENTIGKYKDMLIHMNDGMTDYDIRRFILQTQALDDFDITGELDRIQCPVLVIGSEGDKVLPPSQSRLIAEALNASLYMYSDEYGHCVFDEAPDYKQRLLDFYHQP